LTKPAEDERSYNYKLPDTAIKEQLSKAHLHAIASHADFTCDTPGTDYQSVDSTIGAKEWINETCPLGFPRLDVQLKATSAADLKEESLIFSLDVKNYNDLRAAKRQNPIVLVVLVLPGDQAEWLVNDENSLVAKNSCYWTSLKGALATTNKTKITVHIPRSNVLSPNELLRLMIKVSRGEDLANV
jgi:hypothetical protein